MPRPTFRLLFHLSTLDSRRSPGGRKETTRSLNLFVVIIVIIIITIIVYYYYCYCYNYCYENK